jgi:sirohydrochlorin cobaltochelatase
MGGVQAAMTNGVDDAAVFEELESRLRTLLPEEYQDSYETVQPVSMGSAGLKYGLDGRVAWDQIWGSFCDLAMAGGPPHKGALLEPGRKSDIDAQAGRYDEVTEELCRGVIMATDLPAQPSSTPGWIRVACLSEPMAAWLLRAIVMENIAVRRHGGTIDLPAAPHFRLEKEIKNVVTVIAKTCHYWIGHTPRAQKQAITDLFARMTAEAPLIEPDESDVRMPDAAPSVTRDRIAAAIARDTGLPVASQGYAGWLGVECPTVRAAVWMMRMLVASNVLSRREGTVLFVPVNPSRDPEGEVLAQRLARVHGFALTRGILAV